MGYKRVLDGRFVNIIGIDWFGTFLFLTDITERNESV
jgi:hypothetical protein